MTYEGYWWDIVWRYHCKSNFQLHFYYRTIRQGCSKDFLLVIIFLFDLIYLFIVFFFGYFHGFGKEPLNPPHKSICEKAHLVTIHLQNNFKTNVLASIIFKISRECNLASKIQTHDICKNIFQGNAQRPLHRNCKQCVFLKASQ